jgi:hypothetical protein
MYSRATAFQHIFEVMIDRLKPGEFNTAGEIQWAIYPFLKYPAKNFTSRQIARFIQRYGTDLFIVCTRKDDPKLMANVYCLKPIENHTNTQTAQSTGVEQHGDV